MKTDKYITGKYALNIHHPESVDEPTGDWHGYIWDGIKELPSDKITYAGNGFKINTFHIWDDFGVYEDSDNLRKIGIKINENNIYVADYYRAILDIIYFNLFNFNNLFGLNFITYDHLDNNEQIMTVLNEVEKLKKYVNDYQFHVLEKWINNEKNYEFSRNAGNIK
jgi:hypothetical protein